MTDVMRLIGVAVQSRKITDNDDATVNDPEDLVHHATLGFLVEQEGGILGDQLQLMMKG